MMTSCADPTFSCPSREFPYYPASVNPELGIVTQPYPDVDDFMEGHFSPDLSFLLSMDQYYDPSPHKEHCSEDMSSSDSDKDVGSDDSSLTEAVMEMFSLEQRPPPPPYEPPQTKYNNTTFSSAAPNNIINNKFNYSQPKMPETIDENKPDVTKVNIDLKIKQEPPSPEGETCESRRGRPSRNCASTYGGQNFDSKPTKKVHKPRVKKTIHLWEFLEEIVDNKAYSPKYITWVSREDGVFRLVDSKAVAKLWGQRKNRHDMTYEKMSRAIRYYYERGIIRHVIGQKLIYQFGDEINEKRRERATSKTSPNLDDKSQVGS